MQIVRVTRSISVPIILSSGAVALCLALLVGWSYLVLRNAELVADIRANKWLLAAGIGSLVVIMFVIVLFTVFLVREIREVRRQTSFIDSVTHELKSPLAALKLCLETLARPDLPAPQHERLRQMMHDDVERLSAFIDRVLTATRLAGELRPRSTSPTSRSSSSRGGAPPGSRGGPTSRETPSASTSPLTSRSSPTPSRSPPCSRT